MRRHSVTDRNRLVEWDTNDWLPIALVPYSTAVARTICHNLSEARNVEVMGTEISTGSIKANKMRKNARLEARVTEEQKQLMEKAAYLCGQNLTEFMVSVLAEAAVQIIKDRELLALTERDRTVFAEALLNPPAPSETACADAQWYEQMMNK